MYRPRTSRSVTALSIWAVAIVAIVALPTISSALSALPEPVRPPDRCTIAAAFGTRSSGPSLASTGEQPSGNYTVSFSESGLPIDAVWFVNVTIPANISSSASLSLNATGVTTVLTASLPNGTYNFTVATNDTTYAPSYYSSSVSVDGSNASAPTITFGVVVYATTFQEVGLPPSASWYVNVSRGPSLVGTGAGASLTTNLTNGSYSYSIATGDPTYAPSSYSNQILVEGGPASAPPIHFSEVTYGVEFSESGLPSGASWSVTLNGTVNASATPTIDFANQTNGSYPFTVGPFPGYVANPESADVAVHGAAINEMIAFYPIPPSSYPVTFNETGLSSGTVWSATLNGTVQSSSGSTVVFYEQNGSYSFNVTAVSGYVENPGAGTIVVIGASVDVPVAFALLYPVTIAESGLPIGTNWSATLGAISDNSTTPWISFPATNGTYGFTIAAVPGYAANRTSGSVTVSGAPVNVSIGFTITTARTYPVNFTESGLPSGTTWSLLFRGNSVTSDSRAWIEVSEPNDTYAFSIPSLANWTGEPSRGNVTVAGVPVAEGIAFEFTYQLTFSVPNGTSADTPWSVTLVGVDVALGSVQPSGSVSETTTAPVISFREPNGTYSYLVTVDDDPGYRAAGYVTVFGGAPSVVPPSISAGTAGGSGGGFGTVIYPIVGAVVVVGLMVLVIAVLVSVVSKRKKPPFASEEEPSMSTLPVESETAVRR